MRWSSAPGAPGCGRGGGRARGGARTVIDPEHMGLPFNRTDDGRIDQRRFGGHTRNYGEGPVKRACYAADRTGHMILQTLYQQCLKHGVKFYDEYHVVDLVTEGGELGDGGRAAGGGADRIPGRGPGGLPPAGGPLAA